MIAYIEKNLLNNISTNELIEYSGYSINRLRQKFFNITGDTPSGYIRKRRLTEAAKEILSEENIIDVCLKYGYTSQENFTTSFRTYFGVTPKEIFLMDRKYKKFISRLREVYSIMEIAGLKQSPFYTTLMGCIKGASDYYDLDLTTPMLYGLSGHAFLINIHEKLFASSPYVWNKDKFFSLLKDLGIELVKMYHFGKDSSEEERKRVEKEIIDLLNKGGLGILEFMEYQLIGGYDENGFHLLQPWNGQAPSERKRLSFTSWQECMEKDGFAGFILIKKGKSHRTITELLKEALTLGLEYFRKPEVYQVPGYGINYKAYENWISAVKQGFGESHGNWWNGMVWSECREIASIFFNEITEVIDNTASSTVCSGLSEIYKEIADNLGRIKEKDLEADLKISLLQKNLGLEQQAEKMIEKLLNMLLKSD